MTKYFEEESKSTKEERHEVNDIRLAIPLLFGTTTLRFFLLHQRGN